MSENKDEITALAQTNFRNQKRRFGIKRDDRRRHLYLIGKTGMGKSTVLENMIIQDIQNGNGVAVVDPHGDLVEKVVNYVPDSRVNDVIYFNPSDLNFPIAFNVFEKVGEEHQHLIASGLIGIFKKLWADSWGPRLEYVLRNAILALLSHPDSTLLGVMRLLVDKEYRKRVVDKVSDPVVRSFWVDEYSKYPDRFQSEAIAPIQNKVGQFLSSAIVRNIVGQIGSSFSLREVMDNKKILLLNLAKGRMGEDNSALLGAMLITKIQMAAMSRVDIPEEEREDFYLYVDEFQNFATESFANILSEARKYRLNLIIAHQYIEQLDDLVRAAVFGNVGTMMCFRVGATDAEELVKEFDPYFTEPDLVNLAKYDVYMKLMIDGVASQPFSASTLPPISGETTNKEKIIAVSRERYATPRDVVEDKISRWSQGGRPQNELPGAHEAKLEEKREKRVVKQMQKMGLPVPESAEIPGPPAFAKQPVPAVLSFEGSAPQKNMPQFKAQCDVCGDETMLTFTPDGKRPVYCKLCLKKIKNGEIPRLERDQKQPVPHAQIPRPKPRIPMPDAMQTGDEISLKDAFESSVQRFNS